MMEGPALYTMKEDMEASQLSNRESPWVILIERGESRERYKDSVGIQPTRDITERDRDRRLNRKGLYLWCKTSPCCQLYPYNVSCSTVMTIHGVWHRELNQLLYQGLAILIHFGEIHTIFLQLEPNSALQQQVIALHVTKKNLPEIKGRDGLCTRIMSSSSFPADTAASKAVRII